MLRSFGKSFINLPLIAQSMDAIASSASGKNFLNKLDWPHGIFPDFASGWAAAKTKSQQGHGYDGVVARHLYLSSDLRPSDHPVVNLFKAIEPHKIYDFGGNAGNLYYSYRPHLPQKSIQWVVNDLPNVMDEGRKIAQEKQCAHELSFVENGKEAGKFDALLISGAFHYWEQSVREFLATLACRPQHVFINRSPIHDFREFVTVQRLDRCAFPCIVRNRQKLIADFRAEGYSLADSWECPEVHLNIPLFPRYSVLNYSGLYFKALAQ